MRTTTRNVAIAVLAVGLLAFFVRSADLPAVWREMVQADPLFVVAGIVSVYVSTVVRAIRWQYLLEPIGVVSFTRAFRYTMIGFAATALLPARAGEFIRPYLLARRESFSAAAAFATIVFERVLDLLVVALLLAAFVLFFDAGIGGQGGVVYRSVRIGGLIGAATAIGLLVALVALAGRPEAVRQAVGSLERILPNAVARGLARLAGLFAEGLAVARDPARLMISVAWSVPLWLCIAFEIWITSRAFQMAVPYVGSFLVVGMLVVGTSVPTPGGVGGFHEAYRLATTVFYDVPNDRAVGAAIVVHAVTVIPVIAAGLVYFVQDGFRLTSLGRLATTAVEEDKPGEVPVLRPSGR